MRKVTIASLLVLLMLVAAGGYMMLNNDGTGSEAPDDEGEHIGEWDVYYVQSGSELPNCNSDTKGRLYYVTADAGFQTCTSTGWSFVDLTGPDGLAGADGAEGVNGTDGQDGANGMDGQDGVNGTDGSDGMSALAVTTVETAGSNCAGGGIKIEVGVDGDGNGALDPSEIDHTQYVCNGSDGQDGADGSALQNTMLTSISTPTLQACSSGGRIMQQGLDNGDGGGTALNGVLESGEVDYITTYCSNLLLMRMTDIRSGSGNSDIGYYAGITVMGTRLYFDARAYDSGYELWAHETTDSSTWQVADINPGIFHSRPGEYAGVTVMGTRLYFDADAGSSGTELWMHETADFSTSLVADINPGMGGSNPGNYAGITVMGTWIYFDADDGSSGRELWALDPAIGAGGLIADINSGSDSSNPGRYAGITVMGTRLYFDANDGISGYELWAHETTNSSTWQVADILKGINSGYPGYIAGLTVMGTRIYFDANDGSSGSELWAHETATGSIWQVADISSSSSGSSPGNVAGLTVVGTRLYFDANDGSNGHELWVMDIDHTITYN